MDIINYFFDDKLNQNENGYSEDDIHRKFISISNVKYICDVLLRFEHGYENKKEFYRKMSELMNEWIINVPRDKLYMQIPNIKFLNVMFLKEHKDDIYKWTFYNEKDKNIPSAYDTDKIIQNIAWNSDSISYARDMNLNLLGSQLHPRHVSQLHLVRRHYDYKQEEPIYDSHFESKGNHVRGFAMDRRGYNNSGFGYFSNWS